MNLFLLFSTLVKLESRFNNLITVGTDGEVAIVQARHANLHGDTVYLRCFIHMRDCIRRKLREFLIPEQDIEQDIFGLQRGKDGLVDLATPEEFNKQLAVVKIKWDTQERSIYPQQEPRFYQWFVRNEADVIKTYTLSSVRIKAGLGSPPMPYTTNHNESMNKVVKASEIELGSTCGQNVQLD